jgi:hypothetical protein
LFAVRTAVLRNPPDALSPASASTKKQTTAAIKARLRMRISIDTNHLSSIFEV